MLRQTLSPSSLLILMIEKYTCRNLFTNHCNRAVSKIRCGSCLAVYVLFSSALNKCLGKGIQKYTKNYTLVRSIYRKGCRKALFLNVSHVFSDIRLQLLKHTSLSLINNVLDFNILVYC